MTFDVDPVLYVAIKATGELLGREAAAAKSREIQFRNLVARVAPGVKYERVELRPNNTIELIKKPARSIPFPEPAKKE